jgi:hypothetical protein
MSPTRKAHLKRSYFKLRPFRRHSLVLLVAGLVYMCVGLAYMLAHPTPSALMGLAIALSWAPLSFWGGVWFGVGLLAVISARWPPIFESWGYMVLTGMAAGWSATYLMGILFANAPVANLTAVLVWGLLAFLWWAVSGLLNPDKEAVRTNAPRIGGDS